ncbi:replication initiator protein A [Anatilimnocola floriformis]|uniref:replication initiator protein A n=1 Tax=Anatilimnocola floriformis TaxID=2948575 RepID=UPI0020C5107C|nr:replication initiator protein A [Anatilimnocola floriformis]
MNELLPLITYQPSPLEPSADAERVPATPTVATRSPLLPDRRPKRDFFVCDIFDAAIKSDIASLEHPIFSLSTKPDHNVRVYEHGDIFVKIKPSSDGLATVHDRDVLIFCISQLMAGLKEQRPASQIVRFKAHELLTATNRMTNGQGYDALKAAMERLAGTRISTNIVTGGKEVFETFGLIESARIVRETRDGRMQEVEVKLSDWVFNAIERSEVLTLHRDYFRLRRPLERRMYELGRKHCGRQSEWKISLELMQKKCGSTSTLKEFRRMVHEIVEQDAKHGHIPDYSVTLDDSDMVLFRNRGALMVKSLETPRLRMSLNAETYLDARVLAPGWDVYYLEGEWLDWITEAPRNADAAFLGFCKKWYERRGPPK